MDSVYARASINYLDGEQFLPIGIDALNGRAVDGLNWQVNGFELRHHVSAVTDWHDEEALAGGYCDEIEALARDLCHCDHVLFFPPLVRSPAAAAQHHDFAPVHLAHSDYTEGYADMIRDRAHPYRRVIAPSIARAGLSDAQIANCSRVLTLQFWRNVGSPLMDYPLIVCDATSVARDDLVAIDVPEYGGQKTEFESFALRADGHLQCHRWYTFPQMREDEVLIFRAFDSDCLASARPFWTPHSAFADPNAGANPVPRQSVEMRAICLFD